MVLYRVREREKEREGWVAVGLTRPIDLSEQCLGCAIRVSTYEAICRVCRGTLVSLPTLRYPCLAVAFAVVANVPPAHQLAPHGSASCQMCVFCSSSCASFYVQLLWKTDREPPPGRRKKAWRLIGSRYGSAGFACRSAGRPTQPRSEEKHPLLPLPCLVLSCLAFSSRET